MDWYYIVSICIFWVWIGKGCEVLAKESIHVNTDQAGNVLIIFFWPIILLVASMELGK